MKLSTLLRLGAVCAAAASMPASAAFSGPLAPANWTTTTTGPTFGSGVDSTAAPNAITLIGGDDPSFGGCPDGTSPGFIGGCQISYTIGLAGSYSFHWDYSTSDISPQYDSFDLLVDGNRIELTANGGDVTQSGDMLVQANSSFGWYINCTDCTGGASEATISNLQNVVAVPEPATCALFALGLAAIGGLSSMRRRSIG